MKIKQFRYSADNLAYLVYGENEAVAIDGGAVGDILKFIDVNGLVLKYVTNTHGHYDHVPGNSGLLSKTEAEFISFDLLCGQGFIEIGGERLEVIETPGHTEDSVVFYTGKEIITGDTLFTGTIGNCFTGDLGGFYHSIKKIMALPDSTIVYPGHDYVGDAMKYATIIDPGNSDIEAFMSKYDPDHVFSTLEDEYRVNPYLRFNDEKIISIMKKRGLKTDTEFQRWESIMEVY